MIGLVTYFNTGEEYGSVCNKMPVRLSKYAGINLLGNAIVY